MSEKLEKFKEVLREVFQMDQAELDFGIYRIMNQKRDEIEKFLNHDLLPQVKKLLEQNKSEDSKFLKDELERAIENAKSIGVDPNTVPKVRELQEKYSAQAYTTVLENEVFSHLANFFRRYYDNGDFISQRRYKKDVYAIPYEGEEVKLYWANYDQYYIKTTEYFKNYSFKLVDGKKINFIVVEATTEQNNNRAANAKERRFFLAEENPVSINNSELNIRFHYDFKDAKQKDLNEDAFEKIKNILPSLHGEGINGTDFIGILDRRPTQKNPNRTLLEKHINDYTARNTFDYFIHKDLGGFLRRELDFFIKNEVLYIDDINELDEKQFHKQVSAIKVIKQVGQKVIAFLEQLENFQKKLWLKKKFVVETNYCITLDRVPKELWNEIISNQTQIDEWKRLFAIQEIQGDLEREAFSEPVTERFLEQNKYLVLDTSFFGEEFKTKILKSINKLDEEIDGLLIQSENFQALNLLLERYKEQTKCIYIDPPYNTGDDVNFCYKDRFEHSSWLSMMVDRVRLSHNYLKSDGFLASNIDEHEHLALEKILKKVFGEENDLGKLIWDKRNPKGDAKGLAVQHEYIHFASKEFNLHKDKELFFVRNKDNAQTILDKAETLIRKNKGISENVRKEFKEWLAKQDFTGGEKAYNEIDDDGNVYQSVSMAWPNKKKAPQDFFIPLIHPFTKKPCPIPRRGWRNSPSTMKELLNANLILFGNDETTQPRRKYLLNENLLENVPSLYYYGASDDDLFSNLGLEFDNPKPVNVAKYILNICSRSRNSISIDYFAGSGTTGHAVINLNREDTGNRKYILVEMGEYFDTVTKPRIQKVIYSKDWKDGKPVSREGISHCFKYLRLESYEDTLNNLEIKRSQSQQQTLDMNDRFREGYLLSYMLDVETEGSASLLNVEKFEDPFNYYLNITRNNETKPTKIDLVETFNYLIGLVVETVDVLDGYKVITGKNLDDEKILIIWRNLSQKSNDDLNAFFGRIRVNIHDSEFDQIYVNGDNYLENMKLEEDKWKVVLIEEEFKKRMFESVNA